jgi:cyclopropane fatty-acyl-phospholipid synthase-like methyltransferase
MENKQSLNFFENLAKNNPDEKSVKITKVSDFSELDSNFIQKFTTADSEVLDLASGSGLIINKFYKQVKRIVAVEAFSEFSKFIIDSPNVEIVINDITKFESSEKFDLITMFGIVQYFNEIEIKAIYYKYFHYLKPGGKFIIKNQFGVKEDVIINGYSEELKTDYFSNYRFIGKENQILQSIGFQNIEVFDIYPPECNRWENTHFYALIASK